MTLAMKLDEEREEGREEGRAEGRKRTFIALLQYTSEEEAAQISMITPDEIAEVKRELGIG